jgi:hypothetical protein
MSRIQIVPTHRPLHVLLDLAYWRQLMTRAAPSTPMGGRVIRLAAPAATLWVAALVMAPMLVVGVAATAV